MQPVAKTKIQFGYDSFTCPFCGGKVESNVRVSDTDGFISHTLPMCREFIGMPADEFLRRARIRMENLN